VWILTGSRNEIQTNNGISHLIEHMMFKGTKKRSAKDIAEAFDSIGGQVNAFTSKEYTCYFARVMDTHKDHALEVLSDMFFNSTFDEAELEKEKKVVSEEIKMYEDAPDDIVHDLLAKAAYGEHSLGYPILGTDKQLESFTREDLFAYKDKFYNPSNVVISVAGNVEADFINQVESHFNQFENESKSNLIEKPTFIAEDLRRSKDTEQAHLCFGYDGISIHDERYSSLAVLNNVLGGSMSSRLFQEVREEKGLAYAVYSGHSSHLDSGLLTIYAGTGNDSLPLLKSTIEATIDKLASVGITDSELKNSQEQLKGQIMLSLENTSSRMMRNGRNELLLGKHRSLDDIILDINSVDHVSIKDVSDQLFSKRPAIALIAP
ncbi:MAG TPA: pitrilysin family protein, partial [Pseudogracilibacillus sp.]|nr:pitrilysin family protein [Pseudogracilibacillus sp.]